MHRGAEGASVKAAWLVKLYHCLVPKHIDTTMAYLHRMSSIDHFVREGITDRSSFHWTGGAQSAVFSFHKLRVLVNKYVDGILGWGDRVDVDRFILELLRRCLEVRNELSYQLGGGIGTVGVLNRMKQNQQNAMT